jgi:hypothetical protein
VEKAKRRQIFACEIVQSENISASNCWVAKLVSAGVICFTATYRP